MERVVAGRTSGVEQRTRRLQSRGRVAAPSRRGRPRDAPGAPAEPPGLDANRSRQVLPLLGLADDARMQRDRHLDRFRQAHLPFRDSG